MRLVNYLNESIEDKGILKACFMCGLPGAGKSYVGDAIKDGTINPKIVNTDKLVEFFGDGGGVDWSIYGDKIKKLNKKQLVNYLNSMLPLWIDSTSSNSSSLLRRKGILESIGYDVCMVWVDTPMKTALERIEQRKRKVPKETVKEMYKKLNNMKAFYKKQFGSDFYEVKNGEGELTEQTMLDAYKKVSKFFNKKLQNPIGKDTFDEMKNQKKKYLIGYGKYDESLIKKYVDSWYRK